jgi:hypothetical protein
VHGMPESFVGEEIGGSTGARDPAGALEQERDQAGSVLDNGGFRARPAENVTDERGEHPIVDPIAQRLEQCPQPQGGEECGLAAEAGVQQGRAGLVQPRGTGAPRGGAPDERDAGGEQG